jgi:hypothetical protein
VHADGSKLMVTDLGSTNGTEVDGAELAPMANTVVPVGSTVTFGGWLIRADEGLLCCAGPPWLLMAAADLLCC